MPEVRRLMTHPGVGPLTALAFVLIIGTPERFRLRQTDRQLYRADSLRRLQRRSSAAGTHQQARQLAVALLVGGSSPSRRALRRGLAT